MFSGCPRAAGLHHAFRSRLPFPDSHLNHFPMLLLNLFSWTSEMAVGENIRPSAAINPKVISVWYYPSCSSRLLTHHPTGLADYKG
jgi:hypothetical protein